MAKRVSISLDDKQVRILRNIDGFGDKDAEIVKAILISFLSEKGYLERHDLKKLRRGRNEKK